MIQITKKELKRLQEIERQFNLIQENAKKWTERIKENLKDTTSPESIQYYDGVICGINLVVPFDENGEFIYTK